MNLFSTLAHRCINAFIFVGLSSPNMIVTCTLNVCVFTLARSYGSFQAIMNPDFSGLSDLQRRGGGGRDGGKGECYSMCLTIPSQSLYLYSNKCTKVRGGACCCNSALSQNALNSSQLECLKKILQLAHESTHPSLEIRAFQGKLRQQQVESSLQQCVMM